MASIDTWSFFVELNQFGPACGIVEVVACTDCMSVPWKSNIDWVLRLARDEAWSRWISVELGSFLACKCHN